MNILRKALSSNPLRQPPVDQQMYFGLPWFMGGNITSSGVTVTDRTAMQHHAVYTCVRTITCDIANTPLRVERKFPDGGWKADYQHPLTKVLKNPNDRMVTYELLEAIILNTMRTGDAFVVVIRDKQGNPIKLIPTKAFSVTVIEDSADGELYYKVTENLLKKHKTSISTETGATRTIYHEDMVRLRNFSYDNGVNGLSLFQIASDAFGLALATQEAASRAMANGAHINGYFYADGAIGPEQAAAQAHELKKTITGPTNAGVFPMVNGVKYESIPTNVAELQLIEARREETMEVARMFRVPLFKLGMNDTEKAANVSEQEQSYINNTLSQYTHPLEQHLDRVLLSDKEKDVYRIRFDFSKKAEPNEQIRGQFYTSALTTGWMNRNEVREREDMGTIPGGDVYLTPLNTGALGDNNGRDLKPLGETDEDKNN